MSASGQTSQLKSLIEDLDQRAHDLKFFDRPAEINAHCDDLVGQIALTVESAIDHLNKVQDRMINEVNGYRKGLLEAAEQTKSEENQTYYQGLLKSEFQKFTFELEVFKASATASDQALQKAEKLRKKASELRKEMRFQAFRSRFLRLAESDFLENDIIGSLEHSSKDVQDEFAIKRVVLDELPSPGPASILSSCNTEVTAIHFLQDGNIAVGLRYGSLPIWNPRTNKVVCEFEIRKDGREHATAIAQLESGHLVTGDNVGFVDVWDLKAEEHAHNMFESHDHPAILWIKVLPNDRVVVFDGDILIWDVPNVKWSNYLPRMRPKTIISLSLVESLYSEVKAWTKRKAPKKNYLSKSHRLINLHVDESDEDESDEDMEDDDDDDQNRYRYRRYDDEDSEDDGEDRGVYLQVNLEVLSDGSLVCAYLLRQGATIRMFDQDSGKLLKTVTFKGTDIESCTILPSGDAVLCRSDKKVEIYSLSDEQLRQSFRNDKGSIVAIRMQSRNSLKFVHLKDPSLPVLGKDAQPNRNYVPVAVSSSCFSNDGKQLAIGSNHSKLVMWPIQD